MFRTVSQFVKSFLPNPHILPIRRTVASQIQQPLQAVGINDFLKLDIPPREMLLDPILPERSLAMLYAPRGIGKSWLSLSIGLAVASAGRCYDGPCSSPKEFCTLMEKCHWHPCKSG
jgi:hypothetical protein